MEIVIFYLFKVNAAISLFCIFFYLLLNDSNLFQFKRYFLIATVIVSFLLPCTPSLMNLVAKHSSIRIAQQEEYFYSMTDAKSNFRKKPYSNLKQDYYSKLITDKNKKAFIDFQTFIFWVYFLGTAFFFFRMFYGFLKLYLFLKTGKKEKSHGIYFYFFNSPVAPFSFFKILAICKDQFTFQEYQEIIAHENVHIKGAHSIDILFAEIIRCIFWINPFVHLLLRAIKLNLEYIADDQALQTGIDKENYQLTVLKNCLNLHRYSITNLFFSPKIKQRIQMINKAKNCRLNVYKLVLVLPTIILANLVLGSFTAKSSRSGKTIHLQDEKNLGLFSNKKSLKVFEGYYTFQFKKGENVYLKVFEKGGVLAIKELFTGNVFLFKQEKEMEFFNKERAFRLTFMKGKDGKVDQVLAYNEDLWKRVEQYIPPAKTHFLFPLEKAEKLEGYYYSDFNKEAYIHYTFKDNKLFRKPLWNEPESSFIPENESEFSFNDPEVNYSITFSLDPENGRINATEPNNVVYHQIEKYIPSERVTLSKEELINKIGLFEHTNNNEKYVIKISMFNNGLKLTEQWKDGCKFNFFSKNIDTFVGEEMPFVLQFQKDEQTGNENIIWITPNSKDFWKRKK